jgi:SAM-dependent methyltransferase
MRKIRSSTKEFIDLGPKYYTYKEYQHCLNCLFSINQLLGFFNNTKNFLKKISPQSTILDVGCGSGLFILHLSRYFPHMKFFGIDTSYDAVREAQYNLSRWKLSRNITIIFNQVEINWKFPSNSIDVLMATLFCHHLTDEELVIFLKNSMIYAKKAVIIHDLQRSQLSFWLYKIISPFFRNRLISHDGLISIQRGFKKSEIVSILKMAKIEKYNISWRFPFCWRIVIWKS